MCLNFKRLYFSLNIFSTSSSLCIPMHNVHSVYSESQPLRSIEFTPKYIYIYYCFVTLSAGRVLLVNRFVFSSDAKSNIKFKISILLKRNIKS